MKKSCFMLKELNVSKFILAAIIFILMTKSAFSAQKLTCATTHYPPYTIFDESTQTFSGLDVDIIAPLFEQLDIDVKIVNLPWARLKQEIKSFRYDCYFSLGKFEDRESFLEYSNSPTHITSIAIFYPKNLEKIDFSIKTVGVHRGINIHKDIPSSYGLQSSTFHKLPSNEVLFKMLQSGRVDAIVTSEVVGEYFSKNIFPDFSVEKLTIDEYELPVYLAFKKGVVDINKVNHALFKIKASIKNKE